VRLIKDGIDILLKLKRFLLMNILKEPYAFCKVMKRNDYMILIKIKVFLSYFSFSCKN